MTPLVTLTYPLVDGTTARGSEVKADLDAIVAVVNANIEDVNIKTGAAINGNKLSNIAGSRVPKACIEDDAIDSQKLADDPAVDANRAVTTNHIRDAAVTAAKLAAQAVIAPKVKVANFDWTPGGSLAGGGDNSISTGVIAANVIPLMVAVVLAGPPSTTTAKYNVNLHLNTATGFYHIVIQDANDNTLVSLAGVTFRFFYIPLS